MTNQKFFPVGKLGKPHSLKGYQYINIEYFFRHFDLKETTFQIEGKNIVVEDFKKHLKNRNLIKFYSYDSIEKISELRNKTVKINTEVSDLFINEENLPWPGFFIGHELKKNTQGKLICVELYEDINLAEQYLPSAQVASTTAVIATG